MHTDLTPVSRLSRDLNKAAVTLSRSEARYLVDAYYIIQEDRKRSDSQVRALRESGEPHDVIQWFSEQNHTLEAQLKRALDSYSGADTVGRWSREIVGVGPVIAAGLLAHIDISKAPTVGHIWRFAGLDPTQRWEKGCKRPWNAELKTLCWKMGESFVKVSGRESAFYGHIYKARKALEEQRNAEGAFKEQAAAALREKNYDRNTEAYKHYSEGRLPPAHIHARAKRYAVKLFLSAWHEAAYFATYGSLPPNPYPIAHLGHAHTIAAPAMELIRGWREARHNAGQTP